MHAIPSLSFSILTAKSEKKAACNLIRKAHYQASVPRGCEFIGGHIETSEGRVLIGVAALGDMVYCRPRGRAKLADELRVNGWQNLDRPSLVRKLGLVCGLRFAVEDCYRGKGVGGQLAKAVRNLAHSSLKRQYQRVEVMRRIQRERGNALIRGDERDWLVAAGYRAICLTKKHQHHLLYYWADTELCTSE